MNWTKLMDYKDDIFPRGTIFRTIGKYPHEDFVDLFLVEGYDSPSGFSLFISTGRKAGLILIQLSKECLLIREDYADAVSAQWVKKNWRKWMYESKKSAVYVARRYIVEETWTI